MNWENTDCFEEEKELSSSLNGASTEDTSLETEDKKFFQLNKFQDPLVNLKRQEYIALMTRFGELTAKQNFQEIENDLLTENCLGFVFNLFEDPRVVYCQGKQDFSRLYNGVEIKGRDLRSINVDLEKNTGFNIYECQVLFQESHEVIDKAVFEIFSFNDGKISKYQAYTSSKAPAHGVENPFDLTSKDIMLAKVKQINYALAGQPNLERIASLLHEATEYKIWSWDEHKCFTFHKCNLVSNFHGLEEKFDIQCIVPYEVYSETRETEYIISTYVYYLESKTEFPGKKYVWLSTSIFSFDRNLNISQICQQGELHPEDEVVIPFETFPRELFNQKAIELTLLLNSATELFYNESIDFNCVIAKYGPIRSPTVGSFQGMKQIDKLEKSFCHSFKKSDWTKNPDIFIDHNDPSYDVVAVVSLNQGSINHPTYRFVGKLINFICATIYSFEKGKVAKIYQFFCDIPEPIISPFDDPNVEGINIKRLKYAF